MNLQKIKTSLVKLRLQKNADFSCGTGQALPSFAEQNLRGQALPSFAEQNLGGQAMIESMVAISVSVMGLLGILAMLGYSLSTNRDVSRKFVATYLAAEGIEIVKNLIDKNYATTGCVWNGGTGCVSITTGIYQADYNDNGLINFQNTPLKFDNTLKIYNYDAGSEMPFKRKIEISEAARDAVTGVDEIIIKVTVSWSESGAAKSVSLEDRFFDWRL